MVTVKYVLVLPHILALSDVLQKLQQLRLFCMNQPFVNVTDIRLDMNPPQDPRLMFPGLKPLVMAGFDCWTDGGPFQAYLYQYPVYQGVPVPWCHRGEAWAQSNDTTFLARHGAIIAALDEAVRLGFKVDVQDSSGFQTHRSRKLLWEQRKDLAPIR